MTAALVMGGYSSAEAKLRLVRAGFRRASWYRIQVPQELPEPSFEPLRVLLVEDDPRLRESLREVLEEEGHEVQAVPSGNDAIQLAARHRFDLMVTDIKTPGTSDGLSALATIKQSDPGVAGIVITGYSTEEYATRAAKLRVENYLEKPFNIEDFLRTVDELAERKRESQRRLAKEVVMQQTLRWFSTQLVESTTDRSAEEVESFLAQIASLSPEPVRDPREQLALHSIANLLILAQRGLLLPEPLRQAFPQRLAQVLQGPESAGLSGYLNECARDFLQRRETKGPDLEGQTASAVDPAKDDLETIGGSLLNMALLLESTGRYDQARSAFVDILAGPNDPSTRHLVHFGLARVARSLNSISDLETQADLAVEEALRLGPLTHSQALAERGILLALARSPRAEAALYEAWTASKNLKDHDTFALMSLALEHFLGQPSAQRGRLLSHLMRAERFVLATEASGWLLALLLGQPELEPEERRFLLRLSRACPTSLERVVLASDSPDFLSHALPYLDGLDDGRRSRILSHLSGIDDQDLADKVARWRKNSRNRGAERPPLRVFSFAGLRLFLADEPVELNRKKPLLLLLYLLYKDAPVAEERLFEMFWPGEESKGRASLRNTLSHVRKLVCPDGELDPLVRQANSLSLSPELAVWFDCREFEHLVQQGKKLETSAPERAADGYRSAVRLYRGPFLENIYEDWVLEIREQLEMEADACFRWLSVHSLAAQNWAQAYEHAARGLRRDPLSQEFCSFVMQALIGLRRPHEALSTFEACRSLLAAELDIEPTTDMLRLREMAKLSL